MLMVPVFILQKKDEHCDQGATPLQNGAMAPRTWAGDRNEAEDGEHLRACVPGLPASREPCNTNPAFGSDSKPISCPL